MEYEGNKYKQQRGPEGPRFYMETSFSVKGSVPGRPAH